MAAARVLEIDHISKRYGEVVAVHDLSLQVSAGELFGFVGRNGAGKTTTMRIVLGVLAADAGDVRFDGSPLTDNHSSGTRAERLSQAQSRVRFG